jgi:hypothetical protein
MDEERDRKKIMAKLVAGNPRLAPEGVIEIGYMLADFLKASVADADTAVDTGCGFGQFDLWVKVGGEEFFVTVKKTCKADAAELGA